jgi:hypothetical protein
LAEEGVGDLLDRLVDVPHDGQEEEVQTVEQLKSS